MNTHKRILTELLLILTLFSPDFSIAQGKSYIPCDCSSRECTCFIQLGDEGGAVKKS